MKGFDPKWKDFPDYILGITAEIWEGRGIATLHNYYAPDIPVRSPGSMVIGNQGVTYAMSDVTRDYVIKFWELVDELLNSILFLKPL